MNIPRTFKIESKAQIANLGIGAYLQSLDYEKPWIVQVIPYVERRRNRQNALSWIWYGERGKHNGNTPDEEHTYCKLHYGCPILTTENQDFADTYENTILMFPYEIQLEIIKLIPITSLLSVKGFAEYLTTLERDSAKQGCILSKPEDSYFEAMGYTRNSRRGNIT